MFKELARTTFERDRLQLNALADVRLRSVATKIGNSLLFVGLLKSRYSSSPRRNALQQAFGKDQALFGPPKTFAQQLERPTRVAVYASSSVLRTLCTFANYSRDICEPDQATDRSDLGADQGFIREDDPDREPRIWEA